jgi:hypothetical protein
MKGALLSLGLASAVLLAAVAPAVFGQDAAPIGFGKVVPLQPSRIVQSRSAIGSVVAGSSIPMWNYTVTSPIDNKNYSGVMVGASPFMNGARTTNIPTVVIPLKVNFTFDGSVFDPTAANARCSSFGAALNGVLNSPVFQSASFTMNGVNLGFGQYTDEFQRANFYNSNVAATGDSYHTVLSPVTVLPVQTITIPTAEGQTYWFGCSPVGVVDFASMNSIITTSVFPSLASQGVNPSAFPLVVLNNVVMGNPGTSLTSNCCVIGYHGAFQSPNGAPQTYAVADFDTSQTFESPDIQPTSHEVGEWMDDPLGTNPTPAWGHVGQVQGCQNNLEVGDPLSGTPPALYSQSGIYGVTMPNGQKYYPQELAFFSWFYRQSPSMGAGGVYSDGGLFLGTAKGVCQ